jgi:hypothetical protein
MQVGDVVGLDDEIGRVLGEGQHVLRSVAAGLRVGDLGAQKPEQWAPKPSSAAKN